MSPTEFCDSIASSATSTALGVFAKHPIPGRVKTRLAAELGNERAADIATAFLEDTVDLCRLIGDSRYLCYSPANEESRGWFLTRARSEFELWPQPDGDLGHRLAQFFELAFDSGAQRVIAIGTDSPTLPIQYIEHAFQLLLEHDAVLGPSTDGGYYLIGYRPGPWVCFDELPWSTPRLFQETVAALRNHRARVELLPPWYDVDTFDDWNMLVGHLQGLELSGTPVQAVATFRTAMLGSSNG